MKKLLTGLLALVMLVSSVFVLSSCAAKPELDLEDAKKNLEDEEWIVRFEDDKDLLGAGYEETLTAYDKDYEEYISIIKFEKAATAKLYYKQLKWEYDQSIESLEKEIEWAEHLLSKYEDDMKNDEIDELEDEIKELEKELEEYKEEYVIGRSGKYVWVGTEKAIEASKG